MGRFSRLADEMADIQYLAWQELWFYVDQCSATIRDMPDHGRRRATATLIAELLEKQEGMCPYCEKEIDRSALGQFHVDHIIPLCRGGGNEPGNLQIMHPLCNQKKGAYADLRDLVPYLERLVEDRGF